MFLVASKEKYAFDFADIKLVLENLVPGCHLLPVSSKGKLDAVKYIIIIFLLLSS